MPPSDTSVILAGKLPSKDGVRGQMMCSLAIMRRNLRTFSFLSLVVLTLPTLLADHKHDYHILTEVARAAGIGKPMPLNVTNSSSNVLQQPGSPGLERR